MLPLEKAARGLTLSETHIKKTFLDKARGIQNIDIVLADGADDLDMVVLAKKA